MAVAFSASGSTNNASTNPITDTSLTVNVGDSALLLLWANYSANRSFSGTPTWNSVNMTSIATASTADSARMIGIYGLVNPASGAQTLSCPNANADTFTLITASFKGTTLAAFGSTQSATGNSNAISASIATSTYDLIVGNMMSEGVSGVTVIPGGTSIYSLHSGTNTSAANYYSGITQPVNVGGSLNTTAQWVVLALDLLSLSVITLMGQQCQ